MIHLDLIASVGTLLQRHARDTPDKLAYVDDDRAITWAALEAETAALARDLVAQGLQPGQTVAVWLANSVDWVVVTLATIRAGGIAAPITADATLPEAQYRLADSAAQVVFVDVAARQVIEEMAAKGIALPRLVWRDGALPAPAPQDAPLPDEDIHAPAFIVYTSGTTGKPKGVLVNGGVKTGHAAAQNQASGGAPSAMARALPK